MARSFDLLLNRIFIEGFDEADASADKVLVYAHNEVYPSLEYDYIFKNIKGSMDEVISCVRDLFCRYGITCDFDPCFDPDKEGYVWYYKWNADSANAMDMENKAVYAALEDDFMGMDTLLRCSMGSYFDCGTGLVDVITF